MTVLRNALLAAALAALAASAAAQRPPRPNHAHAPLLEAVLRTDKVLKCHGKRVVVRRFMRDGKPQTYRYIELIRRDGPRSRIEYYSRDNEDIDGQIAVEDGRIRSHYYPKDNVIHQWPSLMRQRGRWLEQILRGGQQGRTIEVKPGGKVARRDTTLILIKEGPGPEHRLWIDNEGKAILKHEMGSPGSARGMSWEFRWFRYRSSVDPDEFRIVRPGATTLGPEDRLKAAAEKVKMPPYRLPPSSNFALHTGIGREDKATGRRVLSSIYGEGRIVLTLVQSSDPLDQDRLMGGRRGRSARSVHLWKLDEFNFALVGNLPPPELKRLAALVRR
ncbi:MAG: hypothetical protein IH945_06810 [Armatimonadetes bacterium]|nr:hypothetical protein [Armatimonadota bacterium]